MTATMHHEAMELDVRGLRCPIPYVRAKRLVGDLHPGQTLRVLFSDPEAPIDLSALAHDEGLTFERDGNEVTLRRPRRPAADRPRP
jgi:tRNA 2-thiouridine synthesizing protein A